MFNLGILIGFVITYKKIESEIDTEDSLSEHVVSQTIVVITCAQCGKETKVEMCN